MDLRGKFIQKIVIGALANDQILVCSRLSITENVCILADATLRSVRLAVSELSLYSFKITEMFRIC